MLELPLRRDAQNQIATTQLRRKIAKKSGGFRRQKIDWSDRTFRAARIGWAYRESLRFCPVTFQIKVPVRHADLPSISDLMSDDGVWLFWRESVMQR